MIDTTELQKRIFLGEDSSLELKTVVINQGKIDPHPDSIANELAAFANSQGGTLLFGIDDKTRTVVGIPHDNLDAVEQYVVNAAQHLADPPINISTRKLQLPDPTGTPQAILRVDIPRSLYVHKSTKRTMSTEYLARMLQQRSQARLIRFDEQIVGNATLDDLDPALWERFQTSRTRDTREALLHKLGMATRDEDGLLCPTVAGVLMATHEPQRFVRNAFIQAVAYRGTSSVPEGSRAMYQLDAKDITGPLDTQIIEACRFVFRNMKVAATKSPGRTDIPQYRMTAIFEAMVNAVAHRDYACDQSKIRLRMFSDRIELYSPGAIANSMTLEMLAYRQAVRNETITSLLARCPLGDTADWIQTDRQTLMDRRGEGVRIILEDSEALSGKIPEYFLLDGTELMLTIFSASHL